MSDNPLVTGRATSERNVCLAGAAAGAALGVFVIAVLSLVQRYTTWRIIAYEPLAAFCAALGVVLFSRQRSRREGLIGSGAALMAMLASDVSLLMADTLYLTDIVWVPMRWLELFRWGGWLKVLRYGFGVYLAWYLCSGGPRAGQNREE